MRVVVAPDKFAGTLTAAEAAGAIADGWRRVRPGDALDLVPLADGGPGFVEVLGPALGGRVVETEVQGPLGTPVRAQVLVIEGGGVRTAYVESAQACGLALVGAPSPVTALEATTAGVGDLLRAARATGAGRVVVGVGGTASTDGGRGCLERLGGQAAWSDDVELVVATDVDAPLLGPHGAAAAFAAQKGATPVAVAALERRLAAWAAETGGPADAPGAGAGGGLGYGLLLLGARLDSGVRTVLEAVRLADRVSGADLVVTGEGRFDRSSLSGKVVSGVAAAARDAGVRCQVLVGDADPGAVDPGSLGPAGITGLRSLVAAAGTEAALAEAPTLLADLAALLAAEEG